MEPQENAGAEISAPKPRPPLTQIFFGEHGLRAGWRFVLYVLAVAVLLRALSFVIAPLLHGLSSLWGFLVRECASLVAVIIPAIFLSWPEQRSFDSYGLPRRQALRKHFWLGALWGLLAITVLLLGLRLAGAFYFGNVALHGIKVLKFAAFWAVMFSVVALFEEFAFRGYTQFTLAQGIGFWPAAALLSATFGAVHLGNKGEAWTGALGAACIAMFFCLTLRRTGSLWFAVGMHAAWNWGETFLYSVPDSGIKLPGHLMNPSFQGPHWLTGGTVGPEGSVLLFALIAVMWVAFDRVYPAEKHIDETAATVS